MGKVKSHAQVKLFAAVTYAPAVNLENLSDALAGLLDKIEYRSEIYNFSQFTDYYQEEMGHDLLKQIVVFKKTVMPESLPSIKLRTNDFEQRYNQGGNRQVNIDPGYLTPAKVVLATTKDYTHRIYLGQGIYGDVHLTYQHQAYQIQPWTYPDYRQPEILKFFNLVRNEYLKDAKVAME